jgi:energy-coupling factor transporter ATP-binding protein EcfA2
MKTGLGRAGGNEGPAVGDPGQARTEPARVLLVTGMSGAGRSTALKALEDFVHPTRSLPALGALATRWFVLC